MEFLFFAFLILLVLAGVDHPRTHCSLLATWISDLYDKIKGNP